MRRMPILLAILLAILVAAVLVPAGTASATFHLNKVNEVMTSFGGNPGAQFIETFDASPEPYPPLFAPYQLVIYDAAGAKVGTHVMDAGKLAAVASTGRPLLVSTAAADAALGVTGDEVLDVALPASAGQACFVGGGSSVSCVAWGCISKVVDSSVSEAGLAPGDGRSLQRQSGGSLEVAAPTPRAANRAGSEAGACLASPPKPVVRCVVPHLAGRALTAARGALVRAHCRVGAITRRYSTRVKSGRVISSRPASGARRVKGTRVALVLSRGRPPRRH